MKNVMKDAMILFAITLVAGLLLGVVYDVTKAPIAAQKEKAKTEACQNVFADAAGFEAYEEFSAETASAVMTEAGITGADIDEVMVAKDASGAVVGYVLTVSSHEGYGGDIQFTMGLTNEGVLNGISLLAISETPGLGMKAEDVIVPQLVNKQAVSFSVTKTGAADDSQIDAISGATITTNAIVNGVNGGLVYFRNVLKGDSANE